MRESSNSMRSFFIIFSLLFFGQANAESFIDLSSPQAAVQTFLSNLQEETYNDSLAARPFLVGDRSLKDAKSIAIKFKRVLDGKGIYIYLDEIPASKNYYDSARNKHKYILVNDYPKIFLLKGENKNWHFSDSSIDEINALYKSTFRFGSGQLLNLLPKLGTKKMLGLHSYQYIAIFLLAFISALIYKLFAFFTERILSNVCLLYTSPSPRD